jgi:hypothetical protein
VGTNPTEEVRQTGASPDLVYRYPWPTRAAARSAIFEYIDGFYNPCRLHLRMSSQKGTTVIAQKGTTWERKRSQQ